MITQPILLAAILFTIELVIFRLADHPKTKHWFSFLPSVFWIYFIPMLASTAGLIDAQSPVYAHATNYLLPASLILLLLSVDLKAIFRLGPQALALFFAGSFGIMVGTVAVFSIVKSFVGPEFWSGFGALSASWTGGSANMIAVKEAVATPDQVFTPMVIVDTIVPYVWMGILIGLAVWQARFNRWNRADKKILENLSRVHAQKNERLAMHSGLAALLMFALAALGTILCRTIAAQMPVIKDVISMFAWTIILVTALGLILSLTPARKLEASGSTKLGYWLLYFVLTTIGAKASLSEINTAFILIAAGFGIMSVHAAVLFLAGRIVKAPLALMAAASQANVGGVASAPIVAELYHPGLASVGLLLAILGNIVGTYFGIITAQLCRFIS